MPLGLVVLFALAALVLLGVAQRVLDRMRLTDMQALLVIGLAFVGSFINIPLSSTVRLNVGGALVPLALVVYLLIRAGTAAERWRSVIAAAITAVAVVLVNTLFVGGPHGGQTMIIDPLWFSGIVAGIVGYLAGRSRRGSFIAGVGGVILSDVYSAFTITSPVAIGAAGLFDQVVLSGLVAVGLAELVGESRERLQGGPDTDPSRPLALHQDEGVGADEAKD